MGNKISTPKYNANACDGSGENVDFLAEFYGKDTEPSEHVWDSNYHYYDRADKIYNRTQRNPNIYIEKHTDIYIDPERGIALPYESPKYGTQASEYSSQDLTTSGYNPTTSENPKYIEFIVCKGDLHDFRREKYAVNKDQPDHECRANCECIEQIIKIEKINNKLIMSPLSVSPTSSEPGRSPKICGAHGRESMQGGANVNMTSESPEEITDSDEINDEAFSETSDISTTDTTPINKPNPQKKNKKKFSGSNDNINADDLELEDVVDDDAIIDDETDDDDDDLEGIEDEDITEDGLIIDQSDISSSDLYRMNSRIFGSETDTENDEEFTEMVAQAMDKANQRKTLFDSEDKDILNMNSSSEKYTQKRTQKNNKYH